VIPGGRLDEAATRHRKAAVLISVLFAALVCCSSAAATLTSPLTHEGKVGNPCEEAGSDDDSGGGGRVLVVAPSASGFTGQITANGGLRGYEVGQNGSVTGP
jgi:hypothetical protein